MDLTAFGAWLSDTPLPVIAVSLLGLAGVTFMIGSLLRRRFARTPEESDSLLTSSVLGLLALLLSFTFSLASDRFDARRIAVAEEANTIGTLYLRAQLLDEPYRTRLRQTLSAYVDNRIALGDAAPYARGNRLATNDRLLLQIWFDSAAAFPSIRDFDFSSTFYDSVNAVIAVDGMRKSARFARVPPAIFVLLFLYVLASAGMLGFFAQTRRGLIQSSFFLLLLTLFLLVIVDIDQPTMGSIRESQGPMERMRATLMGGDAPR
jgi:hypothetical protein